MIRSWYPKSFSILQSMVCLILIFLNFVQFQFSSSLYTAPRCPWGIRSCVRPCMLHRYLFFCIRSCIMHRYCTALSKALVAFANISDEQENMNECFRLFFALLVTFVIYCSHLIFLKTKLGFWKPILKAAAQRGLDHLFSDLRIVLDGSWKKMLIKFTLNEICKQIPWCDFVVLRG